MASIRRRSSQPQPEWTCVCGKTVRGNGGQSSHKRSCRPWAEHQLAAAERVLQGLADGTWGQRLTARIREMFRAQNEAARRSLRKRLGLPESADEHSVQNPEG